MTLWFVEERQFDGSWSPVTYKGDKPTEKRPSGNRVRFRAEPKEVLHCHRNLTLGQLSEHYGVDGRFTRV